ncbi:diaminobutyrate acetyltransferase [Roseovarius sp.]|uniref:diaminobutyrate acetyltransferase n=1 Tax=Roseovarius sp. TaxID=1486281 RepID=UPI003D0AF0B2
MPRDLAKETIPTLRCPEPTDGSEIWELVRECKPLDENSMYCNLIQCDHFADTCVLAEIEGQPVGWVSAYVMPSDPETLFVWQVAVSETARGMGLGSVMLKEALEREACEGVTRIQTTITSDNDASWALFRKFTDEFGTKLDAQAYYEKDEHFNGQSKTENLVTITLAEEFAKAA